MNIDWREVIYRVSGHFIAMYPCYLIFCIPFKDEFKRPFKKVILESVLVCAAFCGAYGVLFAAFGFDEYGNINIAAYIITSYLLGIKQLRTGTSKTLFMVGVVTHAAILASTLTVSLMALPFFNELSRNFWFFPFKKVRILVYTAVGWIVHRFFSPRFQQIESRDMRGAWLIPAVFCVMLFYFLITDYQALTTLHGTDTTSSLFPVAFSLLAFLSFSVYVFLLHMLSGLEKKARLQKEVSTMNHQLALQGEHYKSLQEHIAETRRVKHDLRHHISVLRSYIDDENKEKLKEYLDEYNKSFEDASEVQYCENFAVNALVWHYANLAKSEGVSVEANLEVPANTDVGNTDLCIVFGNCIENAIEACRKLDLNQEKFIKISSVLKGHLLTISVSNSFDGNIKKEGGIFLSLKDGGGGIGISSVESVVEKYGVSARFEPNDDNNVFHAKIILRVKRGREGSD